ITPETTVRKFRGKYVLKRAANSFFVHLAGHRSHSSHSSHSSHRSHSSHSSSSHYSGSHFSSSPSPPRSKPVVRPPPPPPPIAERWSVEVLATAPVTFDRSISAEQTGGTFTIAPLARIAGEHFSGYASVASFDLRTVTIATEIRRPATGATTIFAAAIDAQNWLGFRIEASQLSIESTTAGNRVSKKIAYDAARHRFLRLRTSKVAPVTVWETSVDGKNWTPEYVETAQIPLTALRIALSAGTTKSIATPGIAVFDNVVVERTP